jgi:hypothetical protein
MKITGFYESGKCRWPENVEQIRDRLRQQHGQDFWESDLWRFIGVLARCIMRQESDDLLSEFLLTSNESGQTSLEIIRDLDSHSQDSPNDNQVRCACRWQLRAHYTRIKRITGKLKIATVLIDTVVAIIPNATASYMLL